MSELNNENKKENYDIENSQAKVDKMNRLFDRLILPIIGFTILVFVAFSIIPNIVKGCSSERDDGPPSGSQEYLSRLDAYVLRDVLLEDMEANRPVFEDGGYTVVENDGGNYVAFIELQDGTQIFDNMIDSSGNVYSAVMRTKDDRKVTVMIYAQTLFLAVVTDKGETSSSIFRSADFSSYPSDSDADAQAVLSLAPAEELTDMVEVYKTTILSLVD